MKQKLFKKGVLVIILVILFIMVVNNSSNANFTINKTEYKSTAQLASDLYYNTTKRNNFLNYDAKKLIGKKLSPYDSNNGFKGNYQGIFFPTASCWHFDALTSVGAKTTTIWNVIDINFDTMKIYGGSNKNSDTTYTTKSDDEYITKKNIGIIAGAFNKRESEGRKNASYDDGLNRLVGNLSEELIKKNKINKYFDGSLNSNDVQLAPNPYSKYYKEAASKYAERLSKYEEPKQKSTVPVYNVGVKVSSTTYMAIGPYKISLNDHKIESAEVTYESGNNAKGNYFAIKNSDNTFSKISADKIDSNTAFYILCEGDYATVKTVKIKLKWNYNSYNVRIVHFAGSNQSMNDVQPMVIFASSTSKHEVEKNLTLPRSDGYLHITKSDENGNVITNKQGNQSVVIELKMRSADESSFPYYVSIKQNSDGQGHYDFVGLVKSSGSSTKMKLTTGGKLQINNLPAGWYKILETTGISGWEKPSSNGTDIYVNSRKNLTDTYNSYFGYAVKVITDNSKETASMEKIYNAIFNASTTSDYWNKDAKYTKFKTENKYSSKSDGERKKLIIKFIMINYKDYKSKANSSAYSEVEKCINKKASLEERKECIKRVYEKYLNRKLNPAMTECYARRTYGTTANVVVNKQSPNYGDLEITKQDASDSNKKLSGARFVLVNSDGQVLNTVKTSGGYYDAQNGEKFGSTPYYLITDNNGKLIIKNLPYGNYTLEEVAAPVGYKISKKNKNISIQINAKNVSKIIENDKQGDVGNLKIIKSDSTTLQKLYGAEFYVKDSSGNYIVATKNSIGTYVYSEGENTKDKQKATLFETNESGYISIIDLPIGKYTVIEEKAPEGYQITQNNITVTVHTKNRYSNDYEYLRFALETVFVRTGNNTLKTDELIEKVVKSVYLDDSINETLMSEIKTYVKEQIQKNSNSYNSKSRSEQSNDEISWILDYIIKNAKADGNYDSKNPNCQFINYSYRGVKSLIISGGWDKNSNYSTSLDRALKVVNGKINADNNATQGFLNIEDAKNYLKGYFTAVYNKYNSTNISQTSQIIECYLQRALGNDATLVKNKSTGNNLLIRKVDEDDQSKVLNGMVFIIESKDATDRYKYLKYNKSNDSYYLSDIPDSFITGVNGKSENDGQIYIHNIPAGNYEIKEVGTSYNIEYTVPEYPNNAKTVKIEEDSEQDVEIIWTNNKSKKIDISGKVWEDIGTGKNTKERNNLYDDWDYLVKGVKVELVDEDYNTIAQTTTNEKGEYIFKNVYVNKLQNYNILFEYDWTIYQNVDAKIENIENGSKAIEDNEERKNIDDYYMTITGNEVTSKTGITEQIEYEKDSSSGSYKLKDSATITRDGKTATLNWNTDDGRYSIYSGTLNAHLNLKEYYDKYYKDQTEIKNINLGLYEREKPDLSVKKDVYKADVSINGMYYTYNYNQNLVEDKIDTTLGVQFQNKRTENYNLPIYKADAAYKSEEDSKNLDVKVTYKIALINEATNIYSQVNSISEYFSSQYQYTGKIGIGTQDEITKDISGDVKVTEGGNKEGYKYYKFENLGIKVPPISQGSNVKYLYVEFKLPKDEYYKNNEFIELNLENIVEIASYSNYQDADFQNSYAGIDKDSIPDSAQINMPQTNIKDVSTWEDDMDKALGLQVRDAGDRQITGVVFEDATIVNENKERLGNGKYDEGEEKISGVTVNLVEKENENSKIVKSVQTNNGEYTISGFIPSKNYYIEFEWGNDKYSVNDYKGTIRTYERSLNVGSSEYWYKNDLTNRWSDAMDNWDLRQEIDKDDSKVTKMTSTTDPFSIGIELVGENSSSYENKSYVINDVDFGLAERPRQSIEIKKEVSRVKISDASSRVLVDAEIVEDEKGNKKFKDDVKYAVYTDKSTIAPFGKVKAEIDNELFPLTVDVTYKITVTNTSELDYKCKEYYLYSTHKQDSEKVKIKPQGIYDYINNQLTVNNESLVGEDKVITQSDYIKNIGDEKTIIDKEYESYTETKDSDGNYIKKFEKEITGMKYQTIFEEWKSSSQTNIIEKKIANKNIVDFQTLSKEISAGDKNEVEFNAQGTFASTDEIKLENDAEIAKVLRVDNYGRKITNYKTPIYDRAEEVTITPPTGENKQITPWVIISISAMAVLGIGIIFIKKKVLK